jgi:CRP-like cAMP-binding protein
MFENRRFSAFISFQKSEGSNNMSTIEKKFNNGEIIIREGDIGNSFFQLLDGKATVFANYGKEDQVELGTISAGEYFGEMAVIESYPRSSTVVAEGDVTAVEIPDTEMDSFLNEHPEKIIQIMKHLGDRIKAMTENYDEAKGLLADLKSANEETKTSWFKTMLQKHLTSFKNKKTADTKPSAEALRESAEKVSKLEAKNIESYKKGTIIFKKGEVGKCMYLVHGGSVGIYSNYGEDDQIKLTELYPVACFGEMGMISEEARSATAVSESDDTYVEIIRPDDLEEMFKTSPVKVDMILRHLSYRLRSLSYDYFKICQELIENYRT